MGLVDQFPKVDRREYKKFDFSADSLFSFGHSQPGTEFRISLAVGRVDTRIVVS